MAKRSMITPAEQLKKKLYKINLSEDFRKAKSSFNLKEFVKRAKEVRATFKDENILSRDATY